MGIFHQMDQSASPEIFSLEEENLNLWKIATRIIYMLLIANIVVLIWNYLHEDICTYGRQWRSWDGISGSNSAEDGRATVELFRNLRKGSEGKRFIAANLSWNISCSIITSMYNLLSRVLHSFYSFRYNSINCIMKIMTFKAWIVFYCVKYLEWKELNCISKIQQNLLISETIGNVSVKSDIRNYKWPS